MRVEIGHGKLPAYIEVIETYPDCGFGPWQIVSFSHAAIRMTPTDMESLGSWLIEQAKRIREEYSSDGKLLAVTSPGESEATDGRHEQKPVEEAPI